MKNFLFLLSFLVGFTLNVSSQCTVDTWGQYGAPNPTCGSGVFGTWAATTWAYSREYSIVNVTAGNTYEFQSYVTFGGATRFTTITTTANVVLASGSTNTTTSVTWVANFTGQVRFWTHLNASCGASTLNQTRRVRCSTPPVIPNCVGSPSVPTAGQTEVSLSQQLSWPAVSGATGYDVFFGTSPTPPQVSTNQAGTTYNSGTLSASTTYYWRVVPRNSAGSATGCTTWSFTTGLAGCLTAANGLWPSSTFTPTCNGTSNTIVIDAWTGEYSNINVVAGEQYTLSSSVSSDFITIGNSIGTVILASGTTPLTWTSNVTGVVRFYRHDNISCASTQSNRIISVLCGNSDPGPCINSTFYTSTNLPTQFTPTVQALCLGFESPFGQFTDEHIRWDNGIAGTTYSVNSNTPSDWITVTYQNFNGTVVEFGPNPLVFTATNNGSYFIHVSTDGFCGQDYDCRDIIVERVSALPVTLTSFTTSCDNGIPVLSWTTESEQNSDYFQIERSRDGFEWKEVSQVQASGNSNTIKNYQFYDINYGRFEGYYRLKQVDYDGQFEYFGPTHTNCIQSSHDLYSEIFPNPTTGEVFIGIRNNQQETVEILITDNSGRILTNKVIELIDGYVMNEFDLSDYSHGVYHVYVLTSNGKQTHKLVKK